MEDDAKQAATTRATGAAALRIHLGLAFCLLICIPAGVFELSRALGGNTLSWAYVFEWPLFAAFGIYMWWRLLNGDQPSKAKEVTEPLTKEESDQLDAWNRYLEELHADEDSEPR